jgi:hypothetical protein
MPKAQMRDILRVRVKDLVWSPKSFAGLACKGNRKEAAERSRRMLVSGSP